MRLYEPTLSQLHNPVPGDVVDRDGTLMGLIQMRGGTLELDREELVEMGSACRDLLQRLTEAERRRAEGARPIPAHGQPARLYTAALPVPAPAYQGPPAAFAPTTLAAPPRGAHSRPDKPQESQEGQGGQVVPDPPGAAR